MPCRYIRDGILTSENVDKLSTGAEIFLRRLMSAADDYGRFAARPSLLLAALFPLKIGTVTTQEISNWLSECESCGVIRLYEAQSKPWVEILRFDQRHRSPSKYPSPPRTDDSQMSDICQSDGKQLRPNANTIAKAKSKTSNEDEYESSGQNGRVDSGLAFDRSNLIGSVEKMLGLREWQKNGAMWRMRARESPKALCNALEDFFARTPDQRLKIQNRGAWLTDRFERCKAEQTRRESSARH